MNKATGGNLIFLADKNILGAQEHWAICDKCFDSLYCFSLKEGHLVQEKYSTPKMAAALISYSYKAILPEIVFW